MASVLSQTQTRFDAIDRAIDLAHQDAVRVPTIVDRAVSDVKAELETKIALSKATTESKIGEVAGKLDVLAIQFQERTAASSTAIAAALQAAKEAVGQQTLSSASAIDKAQAQTVEALSQLRAFSSSEITAQAAQLNDIKSRLDKAEGPLATSQATVSSLQAQIADAKSRLDKLEGNKGGVDSLWGWIVGGIGLVLGLFALSDRLGGRRGETLLTYPPRGPRPEA
jgi:chromosome segregation ATPase